MLLWSSVSTGLIYFTSIGLAEPQLVLGFSDPEVEDHDGVRRVIVIFSEEYLDGVAGQTQAECCEAFPVHSQPTFFPTHLSQQNSPSQIWFFETVQQTGKDEVPAARLLAEGQFAIRNCHDNNYLAILNHRLVAGLPARRLATTVCSTSSCLCALTCS